MSTIGTGTTNTYDLDTGIIVDMDPLIQMLSPSDIPLQGGMGAESGLAIPTGTCFEKRIDWQDEELLTPRATVAATATTGQTYVVLGSGEAYRFQGGDIILIGAEFVRVSASTPYGVTTDSLVVTRAYSGSAATVATSAIAIGVGSALPEGSDPPTARWIDRVGRYNLTQIFGPYPVQSSETDITIRKYGVSNEFDHQAALRAMEAGLALEQSLWYGVRADDTSNHIRTMNGILAHITTTVCIDSSTTTMTEGKTIDLSQAIWGQGGRPDVFAVSGVIKRNVSGWTSSGVIQVQRADGTRGLGVDVFESDFGTLRVLKSRQLRTQDAVLFERSQAQRKRLRTFRFEMLAKTGDSRKGMFVGEESLEFIRSRHAGKFTALTA